MSNVTFPGRRPEGTRGLCGNGSRWIDLVKASSVLLVVFMHASNTLVDVAGPSAVTTALHQFNVLVEPLRMPIFFLVSGMLAASAIHRPWRATTNRTSGMLYLYVAWMVAYLGFITLLGASVTEPLSAILFAKNGYWYLYAMVLFFVIARLLRNQPAWVVVAVALIPQHRAAIDRSVLRRSGAGRPVHVDGHEPRLLSDRRILQRPLGHSGCPRDLGPHRCAGAGGSHRRHRLAQHPVHDRPDLPVHEPHLGGIRYQPGGADHPQRRTGLGGLRRCPDPADLRVAVARAVRGRRVPPGLCGVHPRCPAPVPLLFTAGWLAARWSCTAGLR